MCGVVSSLLSLYTQRKKFCSENELSGGWLRKGMVRVEFHFDIFSKSSPLGCHTTTPYHTLLIQKQTKYNLCLCLRLKVLDKYLNRSNINIYVLITGGGELPGSSHIHAKWLWRSIRNRVGAFFLRLWEWSKNIRFSNFLSWIYECNRKVEKILIVFIHEPWLLNYIIRYTLKSYKDNGWCANRPGYLPFRLMSIYLFS